MKSRAKEIWEELEKKGLVHHANPETINRIMEELQKFIDRIRNPSSGISEQIAKAEEKMKDFCCPICGNKDCRFEFIRGSNGILGPGRKACIVDPHYVCTKCSVRFEDPIAFTNAKNHEKDVNQNFDGHC